MVEPAGYKFNLCPGIKSYVNMESESGLGTTSGEDAILMQADQEQSSSDSGIVTTGRQRRRNNNNEGEDDDNNDGRDPEDNDDDTDREQESGNHNDHHEPDNPQADNDEKDDHEDGNQNNHGDGANNSGNNGNVEDDAQPQHECETAGERGEESEPDPNQHSAASCSTQASTSTNNEIEKLYRALLNKDRTNQRSRSVDTKLPQRSKSYHKLNPFISWSTCGDQIQSINALGIASMQPQSQHTVRVTWTVIQFVQIAVSALGLA